MDNHTSNTFHRYWKLTPRESGDGDQSGGHDLQKNSESRIRDIQRAERAKEAALIQRVERVCAAEKARNEAVFARMGFSVQRAILPSPRLPVLPKISAKSPRRARKIAPVFDELHLYFEAQSRSQEEDDSSWDLELTAQAELAALAVQQTLVADRAASPTSSIGSVCTLRSVETHTPDELRAVPMIGSPAEAPSFQPTPPPPPRAVPLSRSRRSRLPVSSSKLSGADKEVADGCRLQSVQNKVEAVIGTLERLQLTSLSPPRPPAAPKRSPAVAPRTPAPPSVPHTKRSGTRPGVSLRPANSVGGASKKTARNCSLQTEHVNKEELQPLPNPEESLCLAFKLLSSDDWSTKLDGLKTLHALAQHHTESLQTRLREVCLVVIEEVNNLRSAVACAAMNCLAELYIHLQRVMDPEVELTGRALLLKLAQTTNEFIHHQANLALDAMVQNCSRGRIVSALLNTGLSHRCVAVRGSTAQHLHQLADRLGAARIMAAGRSSSECVLAAVAKLSLDAVPEVRHHGRSMLSELALQKDFLKLWIKTVPEKERRPLEKVLRKAK